MSSTISVRMEALRTDQSTQRRLLRSSFSLPRVEHFSLSTRRLKRGEQFSASFEQLLYCTVNIPILIRLTIADSTVEFELNESSLVLPTKGSIEFIHRSTSTIALEASIEYLVR